MPLVEPVIRMRGFAIARPIHTGNDESLDVPVPEKPGEPQREIVEVFVVQRPVIPESAISSGSVTGTKKEETGRVSREKSDVPRFL